MGAKFRVGRSESQTLKNLIRSYNREVVKMEAKLPMQVHLPPSVDYDDIKSRIHNKRDYIREVNRLKRIKNPRAGEVHELPSGTLITKYEFNETSIMKRAYNQSRVAMLKKLGIEVEKVKVPATAHRKGFEYWRGKTPKDRMALEGMSNALPIGAKIDWVPSGDVPGKKGRPMTVMNRVNKYRMDASVTANRYFDSYVKALHTVFDPMGMGSDLVKEIETLISDMRKAGIPLEEVYKDTAAADIDATLYFVYDPTDDDIRTRRIREYWKNVRDKYKTQLGG